MSKIGKVLAIAATAAVIGGAGLAIAQTGGPGFGPGYGMMGNGPGGGGPGWMMGGGPGGGGPGWMHGGYGPGYRHGWGGGPGAFAGDPSARLDALKAELNIRPEQQPAWDAYSKTVQDTATQMRDAWRGVDFDKLRAMNWQEHQAFMAKLVDQRAAAFKTEQDAGAKLMAALDDSQKARLLTPGFGGPGRFAANGGPPCPGFGYGMMGAGFGPWGQGGGAR